MAHLQELRTLHLLYLSFVLITLFSFLARSQETQPPIVSTDPSYYYNLCAPPTCGNLSLRYPFGLQSLCHIPSRKANCENNKTFHWINPLNSAVLRILSTNYTDPRTVKFVVASDSLFTCGLQVSKPNYKNFGTRASLPLTYTVGTHFNCTAPIPPNLMIPGLQNSSCLGCNGQDPFNTCYYAPGYSLRAPNCETFEVITLGGPPNATHLQNLRAFLSSGFEVTYWKTIDCVGCEASGGRCGVHPLSGSPLCFCPSSVHQANCTDGTIEDMSTWLNRSRSEKSGLSRLVVIAISTSASAFAIIVFVAVLLIYLGRKKTVFEKQSI